MTYLRPKLTEEASRRIQDFRMRQPSTAGLYANLALFGHGDHPVPEKARNVYDLVWKTVDYAFSQEFLQADMNPVSRLRLSAGPGASPRRGGSRTKDEYQDVLLSNKHLLEFPEVGPFAIKLGARSRLSDMADPTSADPIKEGRLVAEIDMRDVISLERYAGPLADFLSRRLSLGTAIGLTNFGSDMAKVADYLGLSEFARVATLDRKRYDTSLCRRAWARALWSVRIGFRETDASFDPRWEYVLRTICGGLVVMPDGGCYHISHGGCSGNPFVQALESLITWVYTMCDLILWRQSTGRAKAELVDEVHFVVTHYRTLTLGDDQVTASTCDMPTLEEFAMLEEDNWGVTLSKQKSWVGFGTDMTMPRDFAAAPEGPFFLGSFIIGRNTWRSTHDLVMKLSHPERPPRSWLEASLVLSSYRCLWWRNPPALRLIDSLLGECLDLAAAEGCDEVERLMLWMRHRGRFEHPIFANADLSQVIASYGRNWDDYYPHDGFVDWSRISSYEARTVLADGRGGSPGSTIV